MLRGKVQWRPTLSGQEHIMTTLNGRWGLGLNHAFIYMKVDTEGARVLVGITSFCE
jgi:hypothetical protein